MKNKITKRDMLFFLIKIGLMLLIALFWNWKNNIKSFKEGYNETVKKSIK